MGEVTWFSSPPDASLAWSVPGELGHLHFIDPNGKRAAVLVTEGPTRQMQTTDGTPGSNVWHIEVNGDMATVSPSVHYVGFWHSPNPVRFRIVESLD